MIIGHFIPIRPQRQILCPLRLDRHDAAGILCAAFPDGSFHHCFIVDVKDNGISGSFQIQHGVCQNISCNGLRYVLRELSAEGFLLHHLARGIGRIVADGVAAKAILGKVRRLIAQVPA